MSALLPLTEQKRLLVLFNSGARDANDRNVSAEFQRRLREAGFKTTLAEVSSPEEFDAIVASHANNHDAIVVGGGDGSFRMAVPALLKADLPLGVWPLGTANDFARSLGIRTDEDCIGSLRRWTERRIDVGRANGQYFLNNATLGIFAEAAARLTHDIKHKLGIFAALSLIPTLWRNARTIEAELEFENHVVRHRSIAVLAGNGRYEGGFPIRYSGLSDGKLHLIVCRARTRWALFPIVLAVALRQMAHSSRIAEMSARRVIIRTSRPQRVALDGDVLSQTPVTIELCHAVLRVLV